jgi:hypothetical protein
VIDALVAPVLHTKPVPVAVSTELPQLLITSTLGGSTWEFNGAASLLAAALSHPFTVCVTL